MFHLGWFLGRGNSVQGWGQPDYSPLYDWTKPDLLQDGARALERAGFDVLLIADVLSVPSAYQGRADYYLKTATMTPHLDPVMVVPYLAAVTQRLGLAVTMTATFYPPWILARSLATLDHYSNGRMGWNIVTSTSETTARAFGIQKMYEHDKRYEMADEYVDLVRGLWESWDSDALVMDESTGVFIDGSKVRSGNFQGKYYGVEGPLNIPRSPQGRPLFITPGASPRGRQFGARNSDLILAVAESLADMKKYKADVIQHAAAYDRNPAEVKLMFTVDPVVVAHKSDVEEEKRRILAEKARNFEVSVAQMSFQLGVDLSRFDPDQPIGELQSNGIQGYLAKFKKYGDQTTLRHVFGNTDLDSLPYTQIVGTADMIASTLRDIHDEVGSDGFFVQGELTPQRVGSITNQLVPELQRRKLVRRTYEHELLKDNLMAF
jgi:long-chain alkane monooxygenase